MKSLFFGLSLIAIVAFQACSDSNTPNTPADYYKGIDKLGNYWVYSNVEIDTNGTVQTEAYTDSTWVNGVQLIDGKQATALVSCADMNGTKQYDTTYVYRDGNKLFAYIELPEVPFDTATVAPQSSWVLVSNPDASGSWLVVDSTSVQRDFAFGGFDLVLKAKMWMDASHPSDTTIKVASGSSYNCVRGAITPRLSGTITPKSLPLPQSVTLSGGSRTQFYTDGLALVAERVEPSVIKIGDGSLVPPFKNPGSLRTLLRYRIQ